MRLSQKFQSPTIYDHKKSWVVHTAPSTQALLKSTKKYKNN